jgi:ParB family chromosome partitioning protein
MGKILEKLREEVSIEDVSNRVTIKTAEKIEFVPVKSLKLSKNSVRKVINREEINLMAKNVKAFGVLQPLEINHNNEVVLGSRRFEAAKLASLDVVPVIRRSSGEIYEIEKQLVSDLHSKPMTLLERAYAFQNLLEIKGMSKYALAKYLNLSNNLVCRTLSVLEASPETINLMKQGKITPRLVAAVLYRLKDKSKEKLVINKIIEENLSVAQAENLVAEINDSNILKKHFLKQVKGFRTSLKRFKDKVKISGIDKNTEEEINSELEKIKEIMKRE